MLLRCATLKAICNSWHQQFYWNIFLFLTLAPHRHQRLTKIRFLLISLWHVSLRIILHLKFSCFVFCFFYSRKCTTGCTLLSVTVGILRWNEALFLEGIIFFYWRQKAYYWPLQRDTSISFVWYWKIIRFSFIMNRRNAGGGEEGVKEMVILFLFCWKTKVGSYDDLNR